MAGSSQSARQGVRLRTVLRTFSALYAETAYRSYGPVSYPPVMTPLTNAVSNAVTPMKPKLRGWLHLCAAPLALAAGIVLIALADNGRARIASTVFAFSAVMLFGTSALYHRRTWGPRGEAILRRLDHANIFLIIAGTYTPFTVLLLHGTAE